MEVYAPIIKGICIAVFLMTTDNNDASTPKWWVAMIALNVMANS